MIPEIYLFGLDINKRLAKYDSWLPKAGVVAIAAFLLIWNNS